MSKVLSPGWHAYGELSIYVDHDGFCRHGVWDDGFFIESVFPYRPLLHDGVDRTYFKAYSGHHLRYVWR